MAANCRIPVIDLLDLPNQLSKLISACEEWGCFRLVNYHEILPTALMSEMKAVARSIFDLPVELKRQNIDAIIGSGYTGLSAKNLLYEGLGFYDTASRRDVDTFCSQLEVSRQHRDILVRYGVAVHELFVKMAEKLAEGLGVKGDNLGFKNWPCQFRMNKYHFSPETISSPALQIHTDSGFLTILQDDEGVSGLEVMNKSGEFIAIDPCPGALIVNLGDMANVWSNGRFCNVKHRVQCKEGKPRFSIASFFLGPREAVEAPPELVDNDHPRMYMPTIYDDYRKLRYSTNLHAGEALSVVHVEEENR